jgi:hydrogenase-4 component F
MRLAFTLALVGFGTKAGLAPLHSWLPDTHAEAPTPVSAVLSGVLLNCALYCLSRFLPIVDPAAPGWASGLLVRRLRSYDL